MTNIQKVLEQKPSIKYTRNGDSLSIENQAKTITRFQWIAINPETKAFSGTGDGTYTLKDEKHIETIDFFSRNNSRIGASLGFDAKVESNKLQYSGKSSKGDNVNEIWKKEI